MDSLSWRPALFALAIAACGAPKKPSPLTTATTASTRPIDAAPGRRDPLVGPHGETAVLMGHRVKIVSPSGSEQIIEPTELHPPPGDRALLGISPTALLFLDDGALLAGMGDGTVTVLDSAGHRRASVGLRGAIQGLTPAGEGLIAVTTQRGVMALMTREGLLRWERQITAERLGPALIAKDNTIIAASQRGVFALSQRGELVFSHASRLLHQACEQYARDCQEDEARTVSRSGDEISVGSGLRFRLDAPHPAVPSLEPTFPLTFRPVLDGSILSLLATGPKELSALVTHRRARSDYDWGDDDKYEVVRIEGTRTTRVAVPQRASKSEVFLQGTKPVRAPLFIDALIAGPGGNPWILGRRFSAENTKSTDALLGRWEGAGQILELSGSAVRERNDLFKVFAAHWLSVKIAAAPEGPANLLCFGHDKPACAVPDGAGFRLLEAPGKVTAVSRIGGGDWLLTDKGEVFRSDGKGFIAVARPEGALFKRIAGTSERDVWADSKERYIILHFDGARWTEVPVPTTAEGFFVRAADDVWGGRMHWDGRRWALVHGAPAATAMFARDRNDVWLGDDLGLWHGTAPGPSPVRLPSSVPPSEGAIATLRITPLPLDAPETRYAVERRSIEVAGGAPLTGAGNVSASPDGALWLQTWDRLVEVDAGGRATTLQRNGRDFFSRWAYPEAKGRGTILSRDEARGVDLRDEVQRIDGARTAREEVQLDHHDAIAVHGDARGSTWVVGTSPIFAPGSRFHDWSLRLSRQGMSAWDEFSPHALVRDGAGFRPVLGLPSASWCDVAAAPDGGAWFAGGLSPGPSGEGILFHARGRLGGEATSRFRAPASLLAVTAVGADDAWAVGAAGTVVHVRGGEVTRYKLASGEWLRAAFGAGPDDVWIGGDGGTLLHYDGRAFHPVDHPLGVNAAFTGIASSQGAVWAVGPAGILRIAKRP